MNSKYIRLITLSAILFSVTLFTVPVVKSYMCQKDSSFPSTDCPVDQAKTTSLWDWIISSKSSQFHFFQLLELIHNYDNVSGSISDNQELRQHS